MILLFLSITFKVQGQDALCGTPPAKNPIINPLSPPAAPPASTNYVIRIYPHIVRMDDGTGGRTLADLRAALDILRAAYEPHKIFFSLECVNYIDDHYYYDNENCNVSYCWDPLGAAILGCDISAWLPVESLACDIFTENAHTDGIDLYILDGSTWGVNGNGRAQWITSTSLVLGGFYSDGTDALLSPTLVHEMGHCLSLWHTHHGSCSEPSSTLFPACEEFVNQPDLTCTGCNCTDCGDEVCDTRATPSFIATTFPTLTFHVDTNCDWTGDSGCGPTDTAGDTYTDLPINNFMSYTPFTCRTQFTPGQANKTKNDLLTTTILNPVLTTQLANDWVGGNLPIGTTTWDKPRHVLDKVYVGNGATLIIENTDIMFEDKAAGIGVAPGGRLIVQNSTLRKGNCSPEAWEGIEILGISTSTQPNPFTFDPLTSSHPNHGIVYLNNATIKEARIGVSVGGTDDNTLQAQLGGVLVAENNTIFENNGVGVFYSPYNFMRISKTNNCQFRFTADFIDDTFPYANTYTGIVMQQTRFSLPLLGNTFENTYETDVAKKGIGILNLFARSIIGFSSSTNNNQFLNLSQGIDYYSSPSASTQLSVSFNTFDQVHKAITLNGGLFASIRNNTFNISNFGTSEIGYAILTDEATGFAIIDNDFTGLPTGTTGNINAAVVVRNAEGYRCEIKNNTFSGEIGVANQFEGHNPHMDIDCNQYNHPVVIDWLLLSNNTGDIVVNDQGMCSPTFPELARRNSFKPLTGSTSSYFHIINASFNDLEYVAQSAAFLPTINDEISALIITEACFAQEQPNNCSSLGSDCNPECWKTAINTTTDVWELVQLHTDLLEERLALEQINEAKTDLEDENRVISDKTLVATYAFEEDMVNALAKLNEIPLTSAENIAFYNLYQQIINGIVPPAGPGKQMGEQETLLRTKANNPFEANSTLAQSIIATYYGETFDKSPMLFNLKQGETLVQPNLFTIYPNPTKDSFTINVNNFEDDLTLNIQIITVNGQIAQSIELTKSKAVIYTHNLDSGLYLIKFLNSETQELISTQKLVVTK